MVDDDPKSPDAAPPRLAAGTVPTVLDETGGKAVPEPRWSLVGYQVGPVLGRGGMGEVVAAIDEKIEREVAVKRMRTEQPTPELVARFLREARIQAQLDHPAIVPVHELGTDAHGRPYFTMKKLAGTTLAQQLAAGDGVLHRMLRAFVEVCFAIELAHTRGFVHRDLKPANIMLGELGEVYVLDWGVARVLGTARTSTPSISIDTPVDMTVTGALLGTPGYMAPEQTRGDDVGTPADIYSLGAILFEILAGVPLHPPGQRAIASTLERPTASPAARKPERMIAPELDAGCVAALAEKPAARPSARQLAERVQHYLDGDRDLEMRRAVAQKELAIAREAFEHGGSARRRLAAQAAGRALAFDPDSREAQQLVTQLLVQPPEGDPPELQASLADAELAFDRQRSRRAMFAFLCILLWLPLVPTIKILSWPLLAALVGACLAMAGLLAWDAQRGRAPFWLLVAGNLVVALLFTRLASPFVITPMLICAQVLALATKQEILQRSWLLVAWTLAALALPLVLEAIGALAPTWRVQSDGVLTWSVITDSGGKADVVSLIFGQIALGLVVTFYTLSITRARRDAQRTLHTQAWHLRQMLPRGTSQH